MEDRDLTTPEPNAETCDTGGRRARPRPARLPQRSVAKPGAPRRRVAKPFMHHGRCTPILNYGTRLQATFATSREQFVICVL